MREGDAVFEFRVLSGWHAGAAVPLGVGTELTLGPEQDSEAELLLSDLPKDASGRLRCEESGWSWLCNGQSLTLKMGQGLRLGEVVVVIEPATRAWSDPNRITVLEGYALAPAADPHTAQEESELGKQESKPADGPSEAAVPDPLEDRATSAAPGATASIPRRQTPRWLAVSLAASAMIVLLVLLADRLIDWATPPMPPPPAAPAQLDEGELRALIAELSIAARLTVLPAAGGAAPALEGVVAGEEEVELLMNALSRLPQRPLLRILTNGDFLAQAKALVETVEPGLSVQSAKVGALTIDGVGSSDEALARLIARLNQALPRGIEISDRSLRQVAVTERVLQLIRERALPTFTLVWEGGYLKLDGRLEEQHVPVWEKALVDFNDAFAGRVRFIAAVEMPSPGTFLRQQVRTVIGGAQPYLILKNGQKVMTGGRVVNYRLVEIRDSLLVWEWIDGHSFAIER